MVNYLDDSWDLSFKSCDDLYKEYKYKGAFSNKDLNEAEENTNKLVMEDII